MASAKLEQRIIKFHLPDNVKANHLLGNIVYGINTTHPFERVILTPDSLFTLTNQGDLLTRGDLDRDEICNRFDCCDQEVCEIKLNAYLFYSTSSPVMFVLKIFVTDENDNPPVFPRNPSPPNYSKNCDWELTIPESAPVGSSHPLPVAIDVDSRIFNNIKYKLLYQQGEQENIGVPSTQSACAEFSLIALVSGSVNSTATTAPVLRIDRQLDRENKSSYNFILVAQDAASPNLSNNLTVCIKVEDVNDNSPVFADTSMGMLLKIPEDTPKQSVLHQFSVADLDYGVNKEVEFSIDWTPTTKLFNDSVIGRLKSKYAIEPKTGKLYAAKPLDYENELERQVVIIVKAVDHGTPRLTASVSLTVSLIDVNDNIPHIRVLDVGLRGQDLGSEGVTRAILHENDPNPRVLKLISVSDDDSVSHGLLSCRVSEEFSKDFRLTLYSDTMYGLMNMRAFDYERESGSAGELTAKVECLDAAAPPKVTEKWIYITLVDTNDNWPQFSESNYQFSVSENVEINTVIGRVYATDADSGPNGNLTFLLSSHNPNFLNYIQLDTVTGVLRTTAKLDRELVDCMEYQITATDQGEYTSIGVDGQHDENISQFSLTSKSNTTGLTITILDVNDNAPEYSGPTEFYITENLEIGSVVLMVISFNDSDLGSNGIVNIFMPNTSYSNRIRSEFAPDISLGLDPRSFAITDSQTLVTTGEIDREKQAKHVISIVAVDDGIPTKLSSTTSLTIFVTDQNDNCPELLHPINGSFLPYPAEAAYGWVGSVTSIPVNAGLKTFVSIIQAKDMDAGENGTIAYILTENENADDGYKYFHLEEVTGLLSTYWDVTTESSKLLKPLEEHENTTTSHKSSSLERSHSPQAPRSGVYILRVKITDKGNPPLSTLAIFYVNISDATEGYLGFSFLFTGDYMNNAIIMLLITMCSFVLVLSLVAFIIWARSRNENDHAKSTGTDQPADYIVTAAAPQGLMYRFFNDPGYANSAGSNRLTEYMHPWLCPNVNVKGVFDEHNAYLLTHGQHLNQSPSVSCLGDRGEEKMLTTRYPNVMEYEIASVSPPSPIQCLRVTHAVGSPLPMDDKTTWITAVRPFYPDTLAYSLDCSSHYDGYIHCSDSNEGSDSGVDSGVLTAVSAPKHAFLPKVVDEQAQKTRLTNHIVPHCEPIIL
ncbi:unnamed protein product [Dicrocoelium dendriticum]|nr:unnamed protein product [Dicrocoelium dendriticum]